MARRKVKPGQIGVPTAPPALEFKRFTKNGAPVHVSVWRQRQRVRVYFDEEKVWDVPRALLPTARYNTILFFVPNVDKNSEYYLSNIRFAVGAPDTRNKLLTEGKWVTRGILFDVNSDKLKPESYQD